MSLFFLTTTVKIVAVNKKETIISKGRKLLIKVLKTKTLQKLMIHQ